MRTRWGDFFSWSVSLNITTGGAETRLRPISFRLKTSDSTYSSPANFRKFSGFHSLVRRNKVSPRGLLWLSDKRSRRSITLLFSPSFLVDATAPGNWARPGSLARPAELSQRERFWLVAECENSLVHVDIWEAPPGLFSRCDLARFY